MPDIFTTLTPEQWSGILDAALSILALACPAFAAYAAVLKRTKDEMLQVFDQVPLSNQTLHQIALEQGKTKAAKALETNLPEGA